MEVGAKGVLGRRPSVVEARVDTSSSSRNGF